MKKKICYFISSIMCFTLLCSMPVFAEEVRIDECQYVLIDDIDEYLTQLNAGLIVPHDTHKSISYYDMESKEPYTSITPTSWPWTDCSNVLGHKWGDWHAWKEIKRVHNGHKGEGYCTSFIERVRVCQRTHCNASESETSTAFVLCNH